MDHETEVLAVHHGCKQPQIVGKCGNVGANFVDSGAHPMLKLLEASEHVLHSGLRKGGVIHAAGPVLRMPEVREQDVARGGGEASTPGHRLAAEVEVFLLREVDLEPKLLLPGRHGLAFAESVGF